MALTYTVSKMQLSGTQKRVSGTITWDSSYLTGGESFDPAQIGLYAIMDLDVRPSGTDATHAIEPAWDRSTSAPKVKAFWGDNANGASAQLVEVTSATNLSACVCAFEAWGV
jgi:hypothetical protein